MIDEGYIRMKPLIKLGENEEVRSYICLSFDNFTQDTVNLIFSHVNAVKRKNFNGKSAYDMFVFTFSEELAEVLGISYVPPEDVIQSPKLLK